MKRIISFLLLLSAFFIGQYCVNVAYGEENMRSISAREMIRSESSGARIYINDRLIDAEAKQGAGEEEMNYLIPLLPVCAELGITYDLIDDGQYSLLIGETMYILDINNDVLYEQGSSNIKLDNVFMGAAGTGWYQQSMVENHVYYISEYQLSYFWDIVHCHIHIDYDLRTVYLTSAI